MFKTTKYFAEYNLPTYNFSFNLYIPKEILDEDLDNINEKELLLFCEKNKEYLKNIISNIKESDLVETLQKEFILSNIKEIIPKMRVSALLNSNSPYDMEDLLNINVNEDGLITLEDYFNFSRENEYMLCLPISDINSNYWIWKEIYDLKDDKNISLKIRLDPLVKNPLSGIYKMTVFSDPLNWNELSKINNKSCAQFINEYTGHKTDLYWQRIGNELHFKCEELPLYEEIENRGSRYFHAIYDIQTKLITHCDGSVKIYRESDFLKRNNINLWEDNSKNYGIYRKIFQADGKINADKFTSLITSFFVRNHDLYNYFEKLNTKEEIESNLGNG